MTDSSNMQGIVDGILAELEQVTDWIVEVRTDLTKSERRRARLAQALDSAIEALDPDDRRPYDRRIAALLGERVATGRKPVDGRHATVLDLLAGWPGDSITTGEVRQELERRGYTGGKNYAANLLKGLGNRGVVARTGYGRYRITRLHPQLVSRRSVPADQPAHAAAPGRPAPYGAATGLGTLPGPRARERAEWHRMLARDGD